MEETAEKRKFKRNKCQAPLTYQFTVFGQSFNGSGLDYSEDGLSFESHDEIKPGSIVLIKHLNCDDCLDKNEIAKGCRTATFATVKWNQERSKLGTSLYQTGTQYMVS